MKKTNIIFIIIGIVLILLSAYLMFGNSKEKLDLQEPNTKISELKSEIDSLEVTEKLELYQDYQIKISEISIIINELESTNYEKYKDKKISLYNYLQNEKKIDKYHEQIETLRKSLENKIKDA